MSYYKISEQGQFLREEDLKYLDLSDVVVSRTADTFFRWLLGEKGHEHLLKEVINMFFSDVGIPLITEVHIEDTTLHKKTFDDNEARVDLHAKNINGTMITIEMQLHKKRGFLKRLQYYATHLYSSQSFADNNYDELHPIISINIVDFELFSNTEDILNYFLFTSQNKDRIVMADDIQFIFLEMTKLKKYIDFKTCQMTEVLTYYLKYKGYVKEEEMAQLKERAPALEEAEQFYSRFSKDKQRMLAYVREHMRVMDKQAELDYAHDEGREEGMKEGIKEGMEKGIEKGMKDGMEKGIHEGKTITAKHLKAAGVDISIITQATGLSEEEIAKL